ncbi:hypothetical protein [Methanoculleus sp.]|uniref:hypothetical protein n=1 Tax=Methanoculleus sp. TaxID=90427 RepID=UPI002638E263|nr:hypothetical protein [Methanoculleus sp.]
MVLTYARSIPGMSASPGIIPDMRYLSPTYLPMLVIGVYALKHADLDRDGVLEALRTLFWLAVIDLPLIFVLLQVIAGRNLGGQVTFVTTLTYIFLAGAAILYTPVFAPNGAHAPALRPVAPRKTHISPPPRLYSPGADVLPSCLGSRRRLPVRHSLLGGVPLLDTGGAVRLVHPVRDLPVVRAGN